VTEVFLAKSQLKEFDIKAEDVSKFSKEVKDLHDVDVNMCFQCRKCASGCPLSDYMDFTPTQIIHAVRLGLKDLVLNSNTYWLCVACGTCSARCPQETGLLKVMDAIADIAVLEGIKPTDPQVVKFYTTGISMIKRFGQMYDLGVAGLVKLQTRDFSDLGMGIKMLQKGKFDILPKSQNSKEMKRIFAKVKEKELQRNHEISLL
jgi:heterodisulfide reductase subunit C